MTVNITYFVHGTTTDNEQGLATGWSPGVLSELGLKQAKELGTQVADKKFDIVFCSDLQRAIDSANLAFGEKYEIIADERLRECDYGDNTEKPSKEFKSDMKANIDTPFPHGESYKDVGRRIANFIDFLKENHNGKHVAIVAHEGPQIALDVLLKGKNWAQAIDEDWRKQHAWQPGWDYTIK
jgi:broad specificity phosphatase PhoE